jgi:hypothetical protein
VGKEEPGKNNRFNGFLPKRGNDFIAKINS